MNPWIVLLGIAGLALAYVVAPVALTAYWQWRRPWRLTCPRTGAVAQIRVAAARASVAEVLGGRATIERCSLWPAPGGCHDECLALPLAARRPMRRGEPPPRARADSEIRMIVVPLDGSAGSEAVLPAIGEVARARGATVRLLRVVPSMKEARGDDDRIVAYADQESVRVETEARAYLKRVAAGLPGVVVEEVVRVGDVATQIVEEGEAAGADLIGLATRRRLGFGRLLKGSVARRVERATTIPLLLVPYGERAAA